LISVLFRLTEPSSGTIIIDGINVLDIGLHDLRSKIAIIPQEPVLFLGTIRNNLDPFEDHKDCEILEALRDVHLYDLVASLPGGLDTVVCLEIQIILWSAVYFKLRFMTKLSNNAGD